MDDGADLLGGALLAALLNVAALLVLTVVDIRLNGLPPTYARETHLSFHLILHLAATVISLTLSARTRQLVKAGARHALDADRRERSLRAVERSHHDLRTDVSAVELYLDRLLHEDGLAARADLVRYVWHSFGVLRRTVRNLHVESLDAVLESEKLAPVQLLEAVTEGLNDFRRRFRGTVFELSAPADVAGIQFPGGKRGVERLMSHLLSNAVEGDGQLGATRVIVQVVERAGGVVELIVEDDGPGFPPGTVDLPVDELRTTKPSGSGRGLAMCANLVQLTGGSLERGNRAGGGCGAWVRCALPAG